MQHRSPSIDHDEMKKGSIQETGETLWSSPFLKHIPLVMDRWAPFILMILAAVIILPRLGQSSLLDWDESIYAQVAREMIQSGDWINLQHGYQPYFEKPPLLMWAIAISYKLLGVNEFAARLPSAISGILLVYVTYLCGKTMYQNRTGVLAGLILLSSFGYIFQSRNGTTNMPLCLFVFMGILAYLRLRNGSEKWWYLFFISCALAFMVKFWAALVLPGVVFLTVLMAGKLRSTLQSKHFWLGLLLAVAIVVPWHVLAYLHSGQAFIDSYVTRNLIQRTLTPLEDNAGSSLYYLDVLRNYLAPWFFLIPFALAFGIQEMIDQQRKSDILVILILTTVGLYTFIVSTKLAIYILPIFPALAILIAQLFELGTEKSFANLTYLISGSLVVSLMAQNKILILFLVIGFVLFILSKVHILSAQRMPQIITSLIFVGFAMIGTIGYIQGNNRMQIWPVYGIYDQPIADIAALAGKNNPSSLEPLIGFNPQDRNRAPYSAVEGPAAMFYSNRPVIVAETWEQLLDVMHDQGSGEIIIAESYVKELSTDFDITVLNKVPPLVYARFSP